MNRQMRRQGGGGMGGGGGFGPDLLRQAQEIQNQMMKAQAEFEASTIEASAGGGAVKVVLQGNHKVKEIVIAREVVDPDDVDMLQDLVMAAFNECIDKLEAKRTETMGPLASGLKLPGM
ncbi:MAG: YbaB/EbfC family nucleoid-associated protein [Dehalococcoidia bacterium]